MAAPTSPAPTAPRPHREHREHRAPRNEAVPVPPAAAQDTPRFPEAVVVTRPARYVLALARIGLGWIFLWAFLDKLFGLGHETASKAAWIHGGSPTKGFLGFAAQGPFADAYHGMAGDTPVDWLFMLGLLGVGGALLLGVGTRVAAVAGAALMLMMWAAVLPPENNPFLDDHIVYALLLVALAMLRAGDTLGFGRRWTGTALVRRHPWLT